MVIDNKTNLINAGSILPQNHLRYSRKLVQLANYLINKKLEKIPKLKCKGPNGLLFGVVWFLAITTQNL